MSALAIAQTKTALSPNLQASFLASGGIPPYTYSVRSGGAGGAINSSGVYTAPELASTAPGASTDTIIVTDATGLSVTTKIMVGNATALFCDIIQTAMGLAQGRVYLWDQKINQPTDSGLYVAVSVLRCKPFGNTNTYDGSGSGLDSTQATNFYAEMQIDLISRDTEARDRKEELVMALLSDYSKKQQTGNSFSIARIPSQFVNLSSPDGAAIPYRYSVTVGMLYVVAKTSAVEYFDQFSTLQETVQP